MLKVTSNVEQVRYRLGAWVSKVGGAGRRQLYSAAANAVSIIVRHHLRQLGSWRHRSAQELGAQPTGVLGKAATRTTWRASTDSGEVLIPTPAVRRAFHDVEIRPRNSKALTIPAAPEAYGKRAAVLAALGWRIFRPGKAKILKGRLSKDEAPKVLYYLKESVNQPQDRSLLPSDEEINTTAAAAMMSVIRAAAR